MLGLSENFLNIVIRKNQKNKFFTPKEIFKVRNSFNWKQFWTNLKKSRKTALFSHFKEIKGDYRVLKSVQINFFQIFFFKISQYRFWVMKLCFLGKIRGKNFLTQIWVFGSFLAGRSILFQKLVKINFGQKGPFFKFPRKPER